MLKKLIIYFLISLVPSVAVAAPNFRIPNHPDLEAKAESLKDSLSVFWFGKPYGNYSEPIEIEVRLNKNQGGATYFANNAPYACYVSGTREHIENAVLPHEVNHMVLHHHLSDQIPRWFDEGLCTLIENEAARAHPAQYIKENGFKYSKAELTSFKRYPSDVGMFYGQSYILCAYLCRKYQGPKGVIRAYCNQTLDFSDQEYQGWFRAGCPENITRSNQQAEFDPATGKWVCPLIRGRENPQPVPTPSVGTDPRIDSLEKDVRELREIVRQGTQQFSTIQTIANENAKILNNTSQATQTLQSDIATLKTFNESLNKEVVEQKGVLGRILEKLPIGNGQVIEAVKNKVVDDSLSKLILGVAQIAGLSTPITAGIIVGAKLLRVGISRRRKRKGEVDPNEPDSEDQDSVIPVKEKNPESVIKNPESVIKNPESVTPAQAVPEIPFRSTEIPRDNEEAIQLLQLRQREGRDVVHDALTGVHLEDLLREYQQSDNQDKRKWAEDLLNAIKIKFNRVIPFPGGK